MSEEPQPPVLVVTALGEASGSRELTAALAVAVANRDSEQRPVLFCDLDPAARPPRPTILSSPLAARLEQSLQEDEDGWSVAARGHVCSLALPGEDSLERLSALTATLPATTIVVAHLPPSLLALEAAEPWLGASGALLRAELPRDRSLAALAVGELRDAGLRVKVAGRALGRVASRRALAGIEPGGAASRRLVAWARVLLSAPSENGWP